MIQYLTSRECQGRDMVEKMFALARRKFKEDLMHPIDERTMERNKSPYSLKCAAYDPEKKEILSYGIWSVTDTRFRDGLLAGRLKEEDLPLYDGTRAPVLFLNTFIITSAYHMPRIFRGLSHELQTLLRMDDLNFVGAMAIAGLRIIKRCLERYQFQEIGTYQGKYSIMYADRRESAVVNALVTRRDY